MIRRYIVANLAAALVAAFPPHSASALQVERELNPSESRVRVGGTSLHVRAIGQGQPLIVLHGGPDFDHGYLLPDLDRLKDAFRLIYYDQRGRGRSAEGVRPEEVTLASDVADLDRVRQHFQLDSVALLGHSWGAVLALEYALRHPTRVSHLILMNPAPASASDVAMMRKAYLEKLGADMDRQREIVASAAYQAGDPEAVTARYRIHFKPALKRAEDYERLMAAMSAAFASQGSQGIVKARAVEDQLLRDTWQVPGYDLMPRLRGLRIPTLVIAGDHDFIPTAVAERIAQALSNARFVTIKDCGHFAFLECPGEVRSALNEFALAAAGPAASQSPAQPRWADIERETLAHFQAILSLDTRNPPGNERRVAEYLKSVFDREGIPARILALDSARANVVARLKGTGRQRPLLIMGHTDVVTVDSTKWTHPPFAATRDGGYVYGRGAVDDKDNVTAGLMTMLLLKRLNVPLDRDVVFLAESGEEGTTRVGIDFITQRHMDEIDAEYCLAEGGSATRIGGEVKYATVQTLEKRGRGIELIARGIAGHGSVPLASNAIVHLAGAVARIGAWRPAIRLNETTRAYFERLAAFSPPEVARHYRGILSADSAVRRAADEWLYEHEPRHSSMLRTSVSPNIIAGGYRSNVIPSEARATLDVRMLPDEDPDGFLEQVRGVVNDPAVEVRFPSAFGRPRGTESRLDSEAFKVIEAAARRVYDVQAIPVMSTGATDMAFVRAKGIQCFGIGPALDMEDGPRGFGAHSDQERILESELHRFVRFNWDIVTSLARARRQPVQ
jgi:proline-specific peptidase